MNLITQFLFEVNFNELHISDKLLLIAFYIVPAIVIGLALIVMSFTQFTINSL